MSSDPSSRGAGSARPERRIVDDTDREILKALRTDARMPIAEVARRVNVSRANAYARIERLTSSGVIAGYQVRVDPRAIGLEVTALIFLTVEQQHWRTVRDKLIEIPEVEFVALSAGDFDFVVLVRASHTDELRDVILERFMAMPDIKGTRTAFLLDDFSLGPVIP